MIAKNDIMRKNNKKMEKMTRMKQNRINRKKMKQNVKQNIMRKTPN